MELKKKKWGFSQFLGGGGGKNRSCENSQLFFFFSNDNLPNSKHFLSTNFPPTSDKHLLFAEITNFSEFDDGEGFGKRFS